MKFVYSLAVRITFAFNLALILLVAFACSATAQLPDVTIKRFDGSSIQGTIISIDAAGNVTGTDLPAKLSLDDILAIETSRTAEIQSGFELILRTIYGGQLRVRNPQIVPESVRFESASGVSELPLQNLRSIVWKSSASIENQIAKPSKADDAVFVQTADGERTVTGIVERLDGEQLQIEYQNESRKIGVSKINAIVMADLGLDSPTGSLASIRLSDGSSMVGAFHALEKESLILKLPGDSTVSVDTKKIVSISIRSDRLQYLSDLQPVDVQQRTEFTIHRSWQPDRSVENNRLAIRYGKTERVIEFNKGLGTQSFTQLDFANSNDFLRFQATVGIDAETLGRGDCQMVVRGDGIELWSERVRATGDPIEVDVEIKDIKKISLVVYPGEDFDLADHADWGNARLVK